MKCGELANILKNQHFCHCSLEESTQCSRQNRLPVRVLVVSNTNPMFLEPTIYSGLFGFSGYIWLNLKDMYNVMLTITVTYGKE